MELSDSERSLNASRRPFSEIEEEDDVECDNPDPVSMTAATGEIKEVGADHSFVSLKVYLLTKLPILAPVEGGDALRLPAAQGVVRPTSAAREAAAHELRLA